MKDIMWKFAEKKVIFFLKNEFKNFYLRNISPLYLTDANNYHQDRWYILSGLIDRYIQTFENDITINLQANLYDI